MANFSLPNIMRLVVMILLAVALAMILCYDSKGSYNAEYLVIVGELVVYITFAVGLCAEEVDVELAQYTDIISIGPAFGLGLYWIFIPNNGSSQYYYGLIMGICSTAASIFMLVAAILTAK